MSLEVGQDVGVYLSRLSAESPLQFSPALFSAYQLLKQHCLVDKGSHNSVCL